MEVRTDQTHKVEQCPQLPAGKDCARSLGRPNMKTAVSLLRSGSSEIAPSLSYNRMVYAQ